MGRPVLSRRSATLACLLSERGVGDSLLLAVMAEVVGVVVSAFLFTPFFWENVQTGTKAQTGEIPSWTCRLKKEINSCLLSPGPYLAERLRGRHARHDGGGGCALYSRCAGRDSRHWRRDDWRLRAWRSGTWECGGWRAGSHGSLLLTCIRKGQRNGYSDE